MTVSVTSERGLPSPRRDGVLREQLSLPGLCSLLPAALALPPVQPTACCARRRLAVDPGSWKLAARSAREGGSPGGRGERCLHSICKPLNEKVCICRGARTGDAARAPWVGGCRKPGLNTSSFSRRPWCWNSPAGGPALGMGSLWVGTGSLGLRLRLDPSPVPLPRERTPLLSYCL